MATTRVFNPTDSPVVIDNQGRVLAGGEWADVDDSTKLVTGLLDDERLIVPPGTADPNATTSAPAPAADNPKG